MSFIRTSETNVVPGLDKQDATGLDDIALYIQELSTTAGHDLYHIESPNQDMYWSPATGQITWTQQINLALTGLTVTGFNFIPAGTVTVPDGSVAYVVIDRHAPGSLTLVVEIIDNFLTQNGSTDEPRIIVFKRINAEMCFLRGNTEKIQKRMTLLDNQATPAAIFTFPDPIAAKYACLLNYSITVNGVVESGTIHVVRGAIGNFGQSVVGASNGSTGVDLIVAESGSDLQLQYTSVATGFAPVIRYSLSTWHAT